MKTNASRRASLRHLCVPHAIDFGHRLLHKGGGGVLTFREFVAVARDVVAERPEETALYLAALVALDMEAEAHDDVAEPVRPLPSAN